MDTNECKVSVIVQVHNSEKTIAYCLKKIISESNKLESEIIVVDDASTDNTLNILKEFKDIKIISLERNKGAGNARNTGANIAKYNNLCFVDSDIYITEDSIINLVKRFKNLIGIPISISEVDKILSSLGFIIKKSKKSFKVEIPSWRPDVTQDVDLIEELIRIKGFDKIVLIEPEKKRTKETLNYTQKLHICS